LASASLKGVSTRLRLALLGALREDTRSASFRAWMGLMAIERMASGDICHARCGTCKWYASGKG
jgi:hypothetical protein